MKYPRQKNGEWVRPKRRGFRLMCCDCGAVHLVNFRLKKEGSGNAIEFQAFKDNRATAASRKARGKNKGANP